MMAISKAMAEQGEPGDIEALLPWHAAGTLNPRDARRVSEALDRDPELAGRYAAVLEEYAATIELNESLGAPSSRAMQALFAAIDVEPAQTPVATRGLGARLHGFFAGLSPKALAWSASVAGLALLLQAGLIGAMLMWPRPALYQTASYQPPPSQPAQPPAAAAPAAPPAAAVPERSTDAKTETSTVMAMRSGGPVVRSLAPDAGLRAFVRFVPDARASEIVALLDQYRAAVIDSGKGGLFRLQFGDRGGVSKQDLDKLMRRLEQEPIVAAVLPAP